MAGSDDSVDSLDLGQTIRGFAAGQKLFGRYTLEKILGRGGMGVVWLAKDEELEREVALKFLPELMVFDEQAVFDLKRETKRSQELLHHHIVRVYDFVRDERTACICMEYVDGLTLSALKTQRPNNCLEIEELKPWMEQLCEALSYAHEKAKVVHRDLKPANLMLNSRNELKITDFGIARSVTESMTMLTKGNMGTSGTLVYMSPQQLDGERSTPLDDIYSFGATVYDLVTGKPPFFSGNVDRQIHEKAPPSMQQRRDELEIAGAKIDPVWEKMIAACLQKDAASRPQSMAEVAAGLNLRAAALAKRTTPVEQRSARKILIPLGAIAAIVIIGALAFLIRKDNGPVTTHPSTTTPVAIPAASTAPAPAENAAGHAWLGIRMETVGQGMAPRDLFPSVEKGVAVVSIDADGPAARTSLRRMDVIIEIDGTPIGSYRDIRRELDKKKPGQRVELTIARQTERLKVTVPAVKMSESESLILDASEAADRGDNNSSVQLLQKAAELGTANAQFRYATVLYEGRLVPRDYAKSADLFRKAADQGDDWAAAYLALQYIQGQGVTRDYAKGAELFQKPAADGNPMAQSNLGWLYLYGKGVTQDYAKGIELVTKASDQGDAGARVTLGRCYLEGRGVAEDPKKAAELFQKAADQGAPLGYGNLAWLYEQGKGVPQDYLKAVELFKKAADKGETAGLASLYQQGKGVPVDYEKAVELYQKAVDQGNPFAEANLGQLYYNGKGVTQNYEKAIELFQKAADQDHPMGETMLGMAYHEGKGVQHDDAKAIEWLQKAINHKDANAKAELASFYETGSGVPQDYARAVQLYEEAAQQNLAWAQGHLAMLYAQGKGTPLDFGRAADLLRKAADQGDVPAITNLGWLYSIGKGVPQDFNRAVELYQKAANQGNLVAQANLGNLYIKGKGVSQNYAKAAETLQKPADNGVASAQLDLGWLYEMGKGVSQSVTKAAELYRKSADQGNPIAQYNLGNLYYQGKGVSKSRSKAMELWEKSAAQGNESAKKALANLNKSTG